MLEVQMILKLVIFLIMVLEVMEQSHGTMLKYQLMEP